MSEREYKYAVFIGRFQPIHNEHLRVIQQALATADELIVVIGSVDCAPSIKNPWSYEERVAMIKAALPEPNRVHFCPVRDYYYNENMWISEVQSQVGVIVGDNNEHVCLIGHFKDHSSNYLNYFPQWEFIPADCKNIYHATDVRNKMFETGFSLTTGWQDKGVPWEDFLVKPVVNSIIEWSSTPIAKTLKEEYDFLQAERARWGKTPYPVTSVTVDAVVVKSGHVLTVRRRNHPGKGLLALPGGFVRTTERIETAVVRELKEETRLDIPKPILHRHIVTSKVFDYPERDPRNRTITHAFLIDLGAGELPAVKGSDDAEKARWLPLRDVFENMKSFYADHGHILFHFLMEKRWS